MNNLERYELGISLIDLLEKMVKPYLKPGEFFDKNEAFELGLKGKMPDKFENEAHAFRTYRELGIIKVK